MVADHDFGTVAEVGREPLVLDYQIADNAVYSDGKPVTCDDMVLTWAAQSGRHPAFEAASRAGYLDIAGIDCQPGQKKARVSFLPQRNVTDYTQLFTATSMMPSHVLSDDLGFDVTTALQTDNVAQIDQVAQRWNTIWNLAPDFNPAHFPSSGPYRIESVDEDGTVTLVANEQWWGAEPMTSRVAVRPHSTDIQDRINDGSFDVVDIAAGSSGTLTTPDEFDRTDTASGGIEQLIFAPVGPLADPAARRAVALCTPRDLIARAAEAPLSNARLHPAGEDALTLAESVPEAHRYVAADPEAAREELDGEELTVRIGYQTPNPRLAATVGTIADACGPAGITVVDAAAETVGPRALRDGQIDVLIASTGGATGSGSTGTSTFDAYALFGPNGNNLSGFANGQIDGVISALAVTIDPKEQARLLAEGAPVLWNEMPTLPLYRQQRTLLTSKKMYAVSSNPTRWGAGWNMDRWVLRK